MSIVFTPALPDSLHLAVPADSPTAVLNFTATLHLADLDQLRRNGGRVQLWSNIPVDGATGSPGDWVSCDFEEVTARTETSTTEVRLGGVRQDDADSQERSILSLQICVPLTNNTQSRFAFTYRLVYRSGEIRWLGEFEQNGTLVVERTDPAFILTDGWVPGEGGLVWTAADEPAPTDSAVIRLVNPAEYAVWTLGRDSSGKSHLAFFVPRLEPFAVHIPPTYILHGSSDTTISVLSEGVIAASGVGSLLLKPLPFRQPELRTLANNILAHCSLERVQVATFGEDAGHLIVASKGTYPIQGFIFSATSCPGKRVQARVIVPLHILRALLPSQTTSFALLSPRNRDIYFFTGSTEAVTIMGDAAGNPFVLSPVVGLKAGGCHVSILSHYLSAQVSESTLPTPPPSPQLRPIAHLAQSDLWPSGSGTSSLSGSLLSLPEVVAAQDKRQTTQKDEDEDEEMPNRQLILRPRTSLLARLRLLCYVVFFILTTALKLLCGRSDHLNKHHEAEFAADGNVADLDGKLDAGSDGASSVPMVPSSEVAIGQGSKQEVSSLSAEIGGGAVLIASRIAPAVMGGARGAVVVEMNGQYVDVKETRVCDDISFLEFDGDRGGTVRISYST